MSAETKDSRPNWARYGTIAALLALIIFRLLLMSEMPGFARQLDVDDSHYARAADNIAAGRWLGAYNENTLIKMPGYPVWLASLRLLGLPVQLGQELLWIGATLALFFSLRRLGMGRFFAVCVVAATLMHPIAAWGNYGNLVRETIHHAQVLLLVALMLRFLVPASDPRRLLDSLGLGLITAFTWWSREESLWLVPVLALGLVPALILEAQRTRWTEALKLGLIATLPVVILVHASGLAIKTLNHAHYGETITIAFEDEDFRAAMGAIMRAEPDPKSDFLPIQDRSLDQLYVHSPALAELQSGFETRSFRDPGMVDADGNRIANYFTFILRTTAAQRGHHRNLSAAKAFYRRLAEEVNQHLDQDLKTYGPRRAAVIPALTVAHAPKILREFGSLALELVRLDFENRTPIPPLPFSSASPELEALTKRVRHEPTQPSLERWAYRGRVLLKILSGFRLVLPWLCLFAGAGIMLRLAQWRRRPWTPLFVAGVICFAVAGWRCALVAAVNVVYSPLGTTYLVAAFPLVMVGSLIVVIEFLMPMRLPGWAWFSRGPLAPVLGLVLLAGSLHSILAVSCDRPSHFLGATEARAITGSLAGDAIEIAAYETLGEPANFRLRPKTGHALMVLWPWQRVKPEPVDFLIAGSVAAEALPLYLVLTARLKTARAPDYAEQREILEITSPGPFLRRLPLRANSLDSVSLNFAAKSLESLEIRQFGTVPSSP